MIATPDYSKGAGSAPLYANFLLLNYGSLQSRFRLDCSNFLLLNYGRLQFRLRLDCSCPLPSG